MAKKPNIPWKIRVLTASLGYIADLCCRPDGTVNRRLLYLMEISKSAPSPIPIDNITSRDLTYDPSHKLWFRLYTPVIAISGSRLPVLVFFHGGGFFSGSPDMTIIDAHCRWLAASMPAVVVSVKYRLAPEYRFPSQFEDGMSVLRFLDDNKDGFVPDFADVSRCFLAGHSCGGNIAHHVAVMVAEQKGFARVRIAGVVAVQPFLGGEQRTRSELEISAGGVNTNRIDIWWKVALPEGSNRDHEAVNIFGPKSKLDIRSLNFPPIMIVIGGFDPLKDWQRRYYDGLKDVGKQVCLVEYPNAIHGFVLFHELPESSRSLMVFSHSRIFAIQVIDVAYIHDLITLPMFHQQERFTFVAIRV